MAKRVKTGNKSMPVKKLTVVNGRVSGLNPDAKTFEHLCLVDMDLEAVEVDSEWENESEYEEEGNDEEEIGEVDIDTEQMVEEVWSQTLEETNAEGAATQEHGPERMEQERRRDALGEEANLQNIAQEEIDKGDGRVDEGHGQLDEGSMIDKTFEDYAQIKEMVMRIVSELDGMDLRGNDHKLSAVQESDPTHAPQPSIIKVGEEEDFNLNAFMASIIDRLEEDIFAITQQCIDGFLSPIASSERQEPSSVNHDLDDMPQLDVVYDSSLYDMPRLEPETAKEVPLIDLTEEDSQGASTQELDQMAKTTQGCQNQMPQPIRGYIIGRVGEILELKWKFKSIHNYRNSRLRWGDYDPRKCARIDRRSTG